MRNDGQKPQDGIPRSGRTNGFIPSSFRAFSSYLKIVSSGASTVASTVRSAASAASSIVDRDDDASHDQVQWAGFDKLECEGDITRRVLLLGYRSGFQVWDVEEANNVRHLVSKHDGPVAFLQMLPKPLTSKGSDKFADSRPLLVLCADGSLPGGGNIQNGSASPCNGISSNIHDPCNIGFAPTVVRFYSLRSQSYVHVLKFRSVVYSVRCSSRVVAISQATQIHCFNAASLEREYTILTNPIVAGCLGSGGIGYGPLAVGPRWLAYSGSPVAASNSGRVSPQHLTPSVSFSGFVSNGSLVAHYAKESSKQLAAGIVTLGDMGYKKLSRYYSELLPDGSNTLHPVSLGWKGSGTVNGHLLDTENLGMVIIRDIVSKSVIAQFRAHTSPISALCFDPSGTLLVTASVQGHNMNVFRIMPGLLGSDVGSSYVHLYRLQRGFTNAVIQDICFSTDSNWIMISSSRGTSHLFAISPFGGSVGFQSADSGVASKTSGLGVMTKPAVRWPPSKSGQMPNQESFCASGPPVTLSVVSRIKSGNNGWIDTVSGAAATATGRMSSLSGAIASSFHNCKSSDLYADTTLLKTKYHLLVFSPSGCLIQYALRISSGSNLPPFMSGLSSAYESAPECDSRLVVEAVQKWNICQKQNRREREDNIDIYGENGISESNKMFPEGVKKGNSIYSEARVAVTKAKISTEERHHLYISEAELQMHQPQVPLWAKPEVYFQSMIDDLNMDEENALGGEIEIEKMPTRIIEARSRDLVPVFDYLQTPKFQQARVSVLDKNTSAQLLCQRSGPSENGRFSCRSSSAGSLDYMIDGGTAVAPEHRNCIEEETGWDSLPIPTETTKGFVNNNASPKTKTQLEIVNNREGIKDDGQLKFVNSNREGLTMENHFEDGEDEFD